MILGFDELEKMEINRRSIPYEEYFDVMDIPKEDKEKRVSFANELEQFVLYMLAFAMIAKEKIFSVETIVETLRENLMDIVSKYMDIDSYVVERINAVIVETIDVTLENMGDAYYVSIDRAMVISENEANTFLNYSDHKEAIRKGMKRKRWKTERDAKVRKTHRKLEGKVLGIEEAYLVGDSLMQFPKDTQYGASAEEIINCRCTVEYFR